MGLAALLVGSIQFVRLRATLPHSVVQVPLPVIVSQHWEYGRWAMLANAAAWVPAYLFYPLLSTWSGLAESARMRALMNLAGPMQQVQIVMALLLLPHASRLVGQRDWRYPLALNRKIMLAALAAALVYWGAILALRRPVFELLYSGKYHEASGWLPLVALGGILWNLTLGPTLLLRALKEPRKVFVAHTLAMTGALLVGIPATIRYGLQGALWGVVVSGLFSWLMMEAQLAGVARSMRSTERTV